MKKIPTRLTQSLRVTERKKMTPKLHANKLIRFYTKNQHKSFYNNITETAEAAAGIYTINNSAAKAVGGRK